MSDLTPERLDALTKRLRGWDHCWPAPWLETATIEAADAITALRAEVERLTRERDEARDELRTEAVATQAHRHIAQNARNRATAAEADAAAAREQVWKLREALADLLSWFPDAPQRAPVWVLKAGEQGSDDAIAAAHAALQGEG